MKAEEREWGVDVWDPDYVTGELSELENLSQKNNIRIEKFEEELYETSDKCKEKVLDIEKGVEIDCWHGIKKNKKNSVK